MSETNTEQPDPQLPDQPTAPEPTTDGPSESERAESVATPDLHDAPEDIKESDSTGYAVYDRTLGQYVPGVEAKKPSESQAAKRVPEGHTAAVVRV